ncbi:MAG: hypothetical protein KIS73_22785 [Enhydrobacter sp.]|nr:hypothetical protein [Enhydrobacter sp.]
MTAPASRGAQLLRRAPSRTRTAREPIGKPRVSAIHGLPPGNFTELYAGPPVAAPENPQFPGHTIGLPFAEAAIQVKARVTSQLAIVLLMVDLGENRDLSRLEFYGNPLLAPDLQAGRPRTNFGLPRAVGLAVREQSADFVDLHRRAERSRFYGDLMTDWNLRWMTQDLRGLWGWTPLHLGPTFGRHLLLAFADFPELPGKDPATQEWGMDLQRLVIYPFGEGVDHHPHVEHSPVAARQSRYGAPSDYWARVGVTAIPDPVLHPSQAFDAGNDALCLPSALAGIDAVSPSVGPVSLYASDPVSTDPNDGESVTLVLQATTDEIPLLSGVRLLFPLRPAAKTYHGPKQAAPADLTVAVHATNDREAAFSPDARHPGWRIVAEERRVYASLLPVGLIAFEAPTHARWIRITARMRAPARVSLPMARLMLRRVDLVRPRSWTLSPEADEDLQVDQVAIRLRGAALLDDYAGFDGRNSVGVTVEMRQEDGAYVPLRSFRTLLELMEETHHRVFGNQRRVDKPVQRYSEHTVASSDNTNASDQTSRGQSTSSVLPEFNNRVVTRSGTVTDYVPRARDNLGNPRRFTSLPNANATGLTTTRTYDVDLNSLAPPNIDIGSASVDQISASLIAWAQALAAQGAPVSIGVGGNVGGNLGASVGVQVGGSVGVSLNVGSQIGGGVTGSTVTGNQGSVTRAESFTLEAETRQDTTGTLHVDSTGRSTTDDRREVERIDNSPEQRRAGVEVRYGGRIEDIVIVTVPIGRLLRGSALESKDSPPRPLSPRDALCVRVDHLPPGLTMDVEFRGRIVPHDREG